MQIIGEKINGTRKRVASAIAGRDADLIKDLAQKQTEAGATWLDVNAGTHPSQEADDLIWLVETVQSVVETPLCLDSPNPAALQAAIQVVDRTPMINSINGEMERIETIVPLVAEHGCPVIALAMDGTQIPETCAARMEIVRSVLRATRAANIPDERVYIDPLAMTIVTNTESGRITLDTLRAIKEEFPDVHTTMGLSNVSFGLPARSLVNRALLTLAMEAGLDSAIIDPLDKEVRAAMLAAEVVLGRDRHCLNYTRAYRAGMFGEVK